MSIRKNQGPGDSSPICQGFPAPTCRQIGGIIFDLDDTLAPEEAFVRSAFRHIAASMEIRYGYPAQRLFESMKNLFLEKERKIFNRLLESLGLAYSQHDIDQLIELYRCHIPDESYSLYPDCRENLPFFLREYRCALITDGHYQMQMNKIIKLGIESLFNPMIINSETVLFKPHREAYERVLTSWKLPPERILCLGDNPMKDFITPLQMGMITVRIRRKGLYYRRRGPSSSRAHYTVNDLRELKDSIALIEKERRAEKPILP
jgi:putative hydrolase of the HAD superfamily